VVSVVVVVLDELGIEELSDDAGGVLALLELSEPVGLPLIELDELGGVALLLLEELGGVVLVVMSVVLELELGDDGVALVEDGVVVVVVVLLVPDLLRSQPVTAAVATASTATKGMSLFMTSPFECGCVSDNSLSGPETAQVQQGSTRTTRASAFRFWRTRPRSDSFPEWGKAFPRWDGKAFQVASDHTYVGATDFT
jgi:hypothetical protein